SERVRPEDSEVVVLLNPNVPASSEEFTNLVNHQRFVRRVVILDDDPEVLLLGMDLAKSVEREVGGVVLRVAAAAKRLRLNIEHADDGEDGSLAIDVLADGGAVREEVFRGIVTEYRHVGCPLFLRVGPHAAFD